MIHVPIISLGRSGSALLTTCLNLHPRVSIAYTPARQFLYQKSGLFTCDNSGWRPHDRHPESATRTGEQIARWNDVGDDSRPILLVRDPRDVICSWRAFMRKNVNREWRAELERVSVSRWAARWAEVHAPRDGLTILYSDLVAHYPDVAHLALRYLGLDERLDNLALQRVGSSLFTAHGTSFSEKATLGRWREEMTDDDAHIVWEHASEVMEQYGFEQ